MGTQDLLGAETRDLGFVAWRDSYADLERMRGRRWKRLLGDEERLYKSVAEMPVVRDQAKKNAETLKDAWRLFDEFVYEAGGGAVQITSDGEWAWAGVGGRRRFEDLDVSGEYVWETRELLHEAKDYSGLTDLFELGLYKRGEPEKALWTRRGVGSEVAVVEGRCYYVLVKNLHRGYAVESCDAVTGQDRHIHMKEDNEEINLTLVKAPGRALYIQADNSGTLATYALEAGARRAPQLLGGGGHSQLAVGPSAWLTFELDDSVRGHGAIRGWPLPPKTEQVVWADYTRGCLITQRFGKTILYGWGSRILTPLKTIEVGTFVPDAWSTWELTGPARFFVNPLAVDPHIISIDAFSGFMKTTVLHQVPPTPHLIVKFHKTKSADGTQIPFHLFKCESKKPAKGLLVYGYGAYGASTPSGKLWALWGPLLLDGWAVAYAYVRGGGDGGESWAEAGRRLNRERPIEDFEAVIRATQELEGVEPRATVISGRSAGGVLIGTTVARHRTGDLVGAAFAEVPYLDVLRTTTNPGLPLTTIEYNEFGNPQERIEDFATVMRVSPVDLVAGRGAPGVFVLSRAGGKDTQVLAYEPLKWTLRLREGEEADWAGKVFGFEPAEGHFYRREQDIVARATDLAILMTRLTTPAVREKISRKGIQMARSTRSATRKVSGGRRRAATRKAGRKASRKARKATRKARK